MELTYNLTAIVIVTYVAIYGETNRGNVAVESATMLICQA